MEQDAKIRRAIFINRSVELREKLNFAYATEVLHALAVYCCDAYGAMLWPLASHSSQMYFRAWNTAVKLTHNVPRSTFTYLVEDFFAEKETSLRNQVTARYPGFIQSLLQSPCPEVRVLSRVAAADHTCFDWILLTPDTQQYFSSCSPPATPSALLPPEPPSSYCLYYVRRHGLNTITQYCASF